GGLPAHRSPTGYPAARQRDEPTRCLAPPGRACRRGGARGAAGSKRRQGRRAKLMAARSDWARHLKSEPLRPVYALVSADALLLSEALQALRGRVLTAAADFNSDELDASTGAHRILGTARTLPM